MRCVFGIGDGLKPFQNTSSCCIGTGHEDREVVEAAIMTTGRSLVYLKQVSSWYFRAPLPFGLRTRRYLTSVLHL
jgi:hypothetical protein